MNVKAYIGFKHDLNGPKLGVATGNWGQSNAEYRVDGQTLAIGVKENNKVSFIGVCLVEPLNQQQHTICRFYLKSNEYQMRIKNLKSFNPKLVEQSQY